MFKQVQGGSVHCTSSHQTFTQKGLRMTQVDQSWGLFDQFFNATGEDHFLESKANVLQLRKWDSAVTPHHQSLLGTLQGWEIRKLSALAASWWGRCHLGVKQVYYISIALQGCCTDKSVWRAYFNFWVSGLQVTSRRLSQRQQKCLVLLLILQRGVWKKSAVRVLEADQLPVSM